MEEIDFGDVEHGDGDKATPPRPQGRRSATPVILEGPSTRAGLWGRDEPEGVKERRHSWRRPHPLRSSPFFGPGGVSWRARRFFDWAPFDRLRALTAARATIGDRKVAAP